MDTKILLEKSHDWKITFVKIRKFREYLYMKDFYCGLFFLLFCY